MANSMIQFRADDTIRIKAAKICERLGIDIQTYMRICLYRLVEDGGIPFSMTLCDNTEAGRRAIEAADRINAASERRGAASMPLDEINAEIRAYRREKEAGQ